MRKQNIADFILYNLNKNNKPETNAHLISELVDNWNHNIYVVPQNLIYLKNKAKDKFTLM